MPLLGRDETNGAIHFSSGILLAHSGMDEVGSLTFVITDLIKSISSEQKTNCYPPTNIGGLFQYVILIKQMLFIQ